MSRQEDFEKAAMDYCEDHSHCIYFEAGAEHGYQYAVDKACKWLNIRMASEMNKEREYWQQARIQASIAIVQGWASTPQGLTKNCMKGAVELADALVSELKGGQDD